MVKIERLNKSYQSVKGEKHILRDIDLEVKKGECVAIIGKSGSGKSTLLNLIGGLDSDYQGSIRVGGKYLEKMKDEQISLMRGRVCGFVFQTPQFLAHLDCFTNLKYASRFASSKIGNSDIELLFDRVGLEDYKQAFPDELSGGQLQRLALARALVGEPELLLCDEPTGNLDAETGRDVIELIETLKKEQKTIILVTHDEELALLADKVCQIENGSLKEAGK